MEQPITDQIERIRQLEVEVTEAEEEWNAAKATAAECKKVFDGRVQALREEIRRTNDPQQEFALEVAGHIIEGPRLLPEAEMEPENMAMPENPGEAM